MRTTANPADLICTHRVRRSDYCEQCDGPMTNSQRRVREDLDLLGRQTNRLAQARALLSSLVTAENRESRPIPPDTIGDLAVELEALASGILDVVHDLADLARR